MVDRAIKVAVLKEILQLSVTWDFLSLCLQLQSFEVKPSEAVWTAKSSSSGFSVNLYWLSGAVTEK